MKTLFSLALIAAVSTLGFAEEAKKDTKKAEPCKTECTKKAEACKTECTKDTKGKTCTHDKSKKDAKDCPAPKKAEDKKPAK